MISNLIAKPTTRWTLLSLFVAGVVIAACWPNPEPAQARVRLENICTIYGQREVKLTGVGLVVGLNGTGDGGRNLPAMRALAATLKLMNSPVMAIDELRDANNVAIVMIEATIPKTGLRRGQKIDCYVSSMMGCKSLRGGRLLAAPLESVDISNDVVFGLASGPVYIEDATVPTSAKIPSGVDLQRNVISEFIDKDRGHLVTLLLDEAHSSFHAAREVARVVNDEFSFEARNKKIAKATGPGVIEVYVPEQYYDSPVEFVAHVLEVGIDNPHTEARVVVNSKLGTVIVTGEVEISPVIISQKNLTVEVGAGDFGGGDINSPFVPLVDNQNGQATQQLKSLVEALNELRVPAEDKINIIRELHRTGKLHAQFDDH